MWNQLSKLHAFWDPFEWLGHLLLASPLMKSGVSDFPSAKSTRWMIRTAAQEPRIKVGFFLQPAFAEVSEFLASQLGGGAGAFPLGPGQGQALGRSEADKPRAFQWPETWGLAHGASRARHQNAPFFFLRGETFASCSIVREKWALFLRTPLFCFHGLKTKPRAFSLCKDPSRNFLCRPRTL